jgi:chromosome segregation ATPase
MMSLADLQKQLVAAAAEKRELEAIVGPLRDKRDAVIAKMVPLEKEAAEIAEQIKAHMPRMSEIDKRLSQLSRQLGHARVGGAPRPFRR